MALTDKKEFYSWIRLAGLLSYIPLALFSGPFFGYLAGNYLVKKFRLPDYAMFICIAMGFLSSIMETIRIIRLARKS